MAKKLPELCLQERIEQLEACVKMLMLLEPRAQHFLNIVSALESGELASVTQPDGSAILMGGPNAGLEARVAKLEATPAKRFIKQRAVTLQASDFGTGLLDEVRTQLSAAESGMKRGKARASAKTGDKMKPGVQRKLPKAA